MHSHTPHPFSFASNLLYIFLLVFSRSILSHLHTAALLAAALENNRMKQEMNVGWEAVDPLCVGPQTADTLWTGVECKDPINKPGVVGKM